MRRTVSGIFFLLVFLFPPLEDLANTVMFVGQARAVVGPELQRGLAHGQFHMVTPIVGLGLAAFVLGGAIVAGPYRRGDLWAWRVLALSGLLLLAAKIWGTATIYAHHIFGGLTVELELPFLLWVAAVALSWRDFRRPSREPGR